MDGSQLAESIVDNEVSRSVSIEVPPTLAAIQHESRSYATRVEQFLSAMDRDGVCDPYQTQVARALLGSLLEALDELDPGRYSRP